MEATVVAPSPPSKHQEPKEEPFGPWMIVGSQNKAQISRYYYPMGGAKDQGKERRGNRDYRSGKVTSRFTILADLEETEGQGHR